MPLLDGGCCCLPCRLSLLLCWSCQSYWLGNFVLWSYLGQNFHEDFCPDFWLWAYLDFPLTSLGSDSLRSVDNLWNSLTLIPAIISMMARPDNLHHSHPCCSPSSVWKSSTDCSSCCLFQAIGHTSWEARQSCLPSGGWFQCYISYYFVPPYY